MESSPRCTTQRGQLVHKGDPLIDIDSRPYRATLLQAQGALERDQGILAQAQMDLDRYRTAWARNAIPKQTLDDQEKLVQQDLGTVKNDQGAVQFDQIQVDFCHIARQSQAELACVSSIPVMLFRQRAERHSLLLRKLNQSRSSSPSRKTISGRYSLIYSRKTN